MINQVREYVVTLNEEVKYYDNVFQFYKSLESTLWGLEEQTKFPENTPQGDQEDLTVEINKCRIKLSNCKKLLDAQTNKIKDLVTTFKIDNSPCGGCQ